MLVALLAEVECVGTSGLIPSESLSERKKKVETPLSNPVPLTQFDTSTITNSQQRHPDGNIHVSLSHNQTHTVTHSNTLFFSIVA